MLTSDRAVTIIGLPIGHFFDLHKKLGDSDQVIIDDYMETKDNLIGFLNEYVKEHPEVDINIIIPNEKNIKKVLEALEKNESIYSILSSVG